MQSGMNIPTLEEVLAVVEGFLDRSGMKHTRFGFEVSGDPNLVADLRKGRMPRLDKLQKIQTFIREWEVVAQGNLDHGESVTVTGTRPSAGNPSEVSGEAA